MKKSFMHRLGLSLVFSLFVFITLSITGSIIGLIIFVLLNMGYAQQFGEHSRFLIVFILILASIIVGTIVSFVFGRVPLKPIRQIISAINKLAAGDFSVRLKLTRLPEVRELTESFNQMAQELGGLEILRTDFVNNFSHEFKTPIVSIKGFAEILKYDDLTNEERNEYLSIIISESDRLASLATNVLNLSKVENQKILSETCKYNISEQIRRCIVLLETKWEERNITFSLDIDEVFFTGNEELLSQVWINLLDNAIKFTPNEGEIWVSLKVVSNQLIFSIRDNGCGIGEDAAKHIFDKFYQADTSHASMGNGLGLTLSKKIVELHGGTISCYSEENRGTEFVILLPFK